jgi:RimJ/RimL family protein N-acetyltransferase
MVDEGTPRGKPLSGHLTMISVSERIRCTDKTGHPFEVEYCGERALPALTALYDEFTPKAISQGLPPVDAEARGRWVRSLVEHGENFLAWREGKAVGHCALMADLDKKDGEYIIFVDQPFRNRGIGSELTSVAVLRARELGLVRLWLTVEAFNFRAVRLYRKAGFRFCDECDRERTMVLDIEVNSGD